MDLPILDRETPGRPADHPDLRLWLRLLTCETMIEALIRRRLRESFGVTLPRFDLMAQLDRAPGGMTLGELSRRMMVSNGNVTGMVETLVTEGMLSRAADPADRRAARVALTAAGRRAFAAMAAAHEGWIEAIFSGLSEAETAQAMRLLGKLKQSAREAGA